eukprot:9494865-Alexandrium_andersonii.AAC.1
MHALLRKWLGRVGRGQRGRLRHRVPGHRLARGGGEARRRPEGGPEEAQGRRQAQDGPDAGATEGALV